MNDTINLSGLEMNHFTIQDAELYCQIFNIDPDNIMELYLDYNKLEDISGISIFKNLTYIGIKDNCVTNLSDLKILKNLKFLNIEGLNLTDESDTVNILKNLPKLEFLNCWWTFKTINIKKELKRKGLTIDCI